MDDFKPLFEYVEKNIENKIELKELADFMGYSPFYISRKFMALLQKISKNICRSMTFRRLNFLQIVKPNLWRKKK